MRHRLSGIPTYRLNGLEKGDEHPAYTPVEYYSIFTFTFYPWVLMLLKETHRDCCTVALPPYPPLGLI